MTSFRGTLGIGRAGFRGTPGRGVASARGSLSSGRIRLVEASGAVYWTPSDSGILAAWYDPSDDANLIFSGAEIVGAYDLSGNGLDYGITGTGALYRGSLNGVQSIAHATPEENRALMRASFATAGYFLVQQSTDANYIMMASSDNLGHYENIATAGSTSTATYANVVRSALFANGVELVGVQQRGWLYTAFLGDCVVFSQSAFPGSWSKMSPYGYNNATAFSFVGQQGEQIFVSSVPTADMRQKFEGYLAHKWGTVAALDVSHPYKAGPPTL